MKKLFLIKWPDNNITIYYGDTKDMAADIYSIAGDEDPNKSVCKELDTMCLEMDAKVTLCDGFPIAKFSNPRDNEDLDTMIDNAYTDQGKQEWKPILAI